MSSEARAVDRARAVRRNTTLLAAAEPALRASLVVVFTVGSVAIFELSGHESWAGLLAATDFACTALAAVVAGRAMDRIGRRPGLVAGYVLILASAGLGVLAIHWGSAARLLLGGGVAGAGSGAANLGRAAVADMYPMQRRGRMVGTVLAVGTVGAVGGPAIAGGVQNLARHHGLDPLLVPWGLVAGLALVGLACVAALRPDPRDLAPTETDRPGGARRGMRELLSLRPFRAAVVSVAVAQASMVAVMGVAPVVVHQHGGGDLTVGLVVAFHVAGMFAFSPLIGALIDRRGRRIGLLLGGIVAAAGAVGGSLAHATPLVATGLFFVGLGWSGAYLGATAIISDLTTASERAGALGFTDLLTAAASAAGALTGGFLLESVGYATVGAVMAVLLVPALALVLPLRESAPGRWDEALQPAHS